MYGAKVKTLCCIHCIIFQIFWSSKPVIFYDRISKLLTEDNVNTDNGILVFVQVSFFSVDFLTCIRKVLCSYSSARPLSRSQGHNLLLPNPFTFINHPTIWCRIVWNTDSYICQWSICHRSSYRYEVLVATIKPKFKHCTLSTSCVCLRNIKLCFYRVNHLIEAKIMPYCLVHWTLTKARKLHFAVCVIQREELMFK
jgi:hypothetical protein